MYKVIYKEEELKWFFDNVVPKLEDSEAHFVSLSARNKYLTDEEQKEYALGRTEMFERRIVRKNDWRRFLRTVRKFETNEGSYVTKNGMHIPSKAIVCYFNINPSDALKAYRDFNKVVNEYMYELAQCAVTKHRMDNILYRIGKMPTTLMNAYQKATGTRYWLDFDFDIDHDFLPYVKKIAEEVRTCKGRAYIIDTKGGFHLLVSKNAFDKDEDGNEKIIPLFTSTFNPKTIVDDALDEAKKFYRQKYPSDGFGLVKEFKNIEIMHNKNAMIPLPGTFQGGYGVTVLNKDV